jgi:hypothetical protein
MSLNNLYKLVSISSKDGSDNLFSYLKFEIVRWLEKIEISGNMLLQDLHVYPPNKNMSWEMERGY